MPSVMTVMTTDQMTKLAQKLATMRFARAKGHIRSLDRGTNLELFRVAVGSEEWLTRYALPAKGLLITLVERKEAFGAASEMGYRKTRFKYVEARVEELPTTHMHNNEGNDKHKVKGR
jgi:hypothetical protein